MKQYRKYLTGVLSFSYTNCFRPSLLLLPPFYAVLSTIRSSFITRGARHFCIEIDCDEHSVISGNSNDISLDHHSV